MREKLATLNASEHYDLPLRVSDKTYWTSSHNLKPNEYCAHKEKEDMATRCFVQVPYPNHVKVET